MNKPPLKKIRGVITAALMTVAVAVAAVGLLATVGHNGPMKVLVVQTGSMTPTIPVGSLVVTRNMSDYRIGDVITYRQGGNFVTHRVVAKTNGAYQTKGDANNAPDGNLVLPSAIAGKVFISLPYAGKFISFVKTPLGFSLLIVLPALFVVIQEIMAIGKELAKMEAMKLKFQPAFVTDVRAPATAALLRTRGTVKSKIGNSTNRRSGGKRKSVRVRVTKRPKPTHSRKASTSRSKAQSRDRLVHAFIILAITIGSLLGGTKAYFSNIGLSQNNIFNTGQFIATSIVINELIYNSSCSQVVEVWNGGASISLQSWKLRDQSGNIYSIGGNPTLGAGQFAILALSNSVFNSNCYGAQVSGSINPNLGGSTSLNTSSGYVELVNQSNVVIDRVAYGSPNPVAAIDTSIERRQLGFDTATGNAFNASDFISRFPATLGFALPTPQTVVINEFMVAPDSGAVQEFIELRNNTGVTINISGWKMLSGDSTVLEATVPASTNLSPGQRYLHQFTANTPPTSGDELSNSENKLFLKDTGNVIQDAFSYHKFPPVSGTSWSRIPEGTNTWVNDPSPTPGTVNNL